MWSGLRWLGSQHGANIQSGAFLAKQCPDDSDMHDFLTTRV